MWWITDNFPSLSALSRYDRVLGCDTSQVRRKFVKSLKTHYLDPKTGLFCTYIDPGTHRQLQGPRGISVMYGLHFLKDFEPDFAKKQYALARRHLIRSAFDLAAVREFPEGSEQEGDVDSGPVMFGLGPSAGGFAIAAAVLMEDGETGAQMIDASTLAGLPSFYDGELEYATMPAVGQAVILFGKTLLLKPKSKPF